MAAHTTPAPVSRYFTLSMILLGVAVTGVLGYSVWRFANARADAEARVAFEFRVGQIETIIRERMQEREQMLTDMSALFASGATVDRERWLDQFRLLRIDSKYPGFQGIGYAPLIAHTERAQLESQQRAAGLADLRVRPDGEREQYTPVLYVAPATAQIADTTGFDMYHEPEQRAAMDEARDHARVVMTSVASDHEQTDNRRPRLLLYLPLYRRSADTTSIALRRAAIQGYVFSSFYSQQLIDGLLGPLKDVRVEIFDGMNQNAAALLYDSQPQNRESGAHAPLFSAISSIPVHGRTWGLRTSTLPAFEAKIDRSAAGFATFAAAAISILAFAIIWSLATLRSRANRLAQRMTQELSRSREQLALALEGSELALFDWDIATGTARMSQRWNTLLGGEAVPVTTTIDELERITHPDDVEGLRQKLQQVLKGEAPIYECEHRVRIHDGSWRWILSRGKVVGRDAQGNALRLVGTSADIHERKEIERLKNEFIATVSHELRTPLTGILGALGLMRGIVTGDAPAKAQPLIDMANRNGERLAKLVNDMLDIQNLESGQTAFKPQSISVTELLAEAVSANAALAAKHGVRFEVAPLENALALRADRGRILQVMANLLSNAAKFSPKDETIAVKAEPRGRTVRISVSDRGPGVPEPFRERIFGKFARADASSTRQTEGSGLGLAVSRLIIEKMGGSIGYESDPERGTTFHFELPAEI